MTFIELINSELNKCKSPKKILFTDGTDSRAIDAALLHKKTNKITPILLVQTRKEANKLDVGTIVIDEWNTKEKQDILINKYLEKRKGKATIEDAKKLVNTKEYFSMLMAELNEVDGVVGGLQSTTSAFIGAAFRVIGAKKGVKTMSSIMVLEKKHEWYIFTDISINVIPDLEKLCHIAANASNFGKQIGFKSKVAFLSFSTSGSAEYSTSLKTREATKKFNEFYNPDYKAIGEIQFDAAFDKHIRNIKYTFEDKQPSKNPTIFVFPSLDAGNIGYKIAQRMAGFGAIGPIILGINIPINDLSRASTINDVYNTALLTALQARKY